MNAAVGADERLVVMLEARISEFERRMRQAEGRGTRTYQGLRRGSGQATRQMESDMVRATGRINQALASTSSKIGSFGKAFVGGAIVGAATVAVASLTQNLGQTVKTVAELGDQAKRAGVSVTALQELKFVGDQNRIGIDQIVDGLKEMSLRADEFVTTGAGSAAESFKRLGYDSKSLARDLEDPSALFLELIGRMGELDTAAQIRVSDELFGGGAGERFAELIGQGKDALEATIQLAHETGAIMDEELIAKAQELDRRWAALQTRTSTFFKTFAVDIADAGLKLVTLRTDVDDLFRSRDQATGILGPGVIEELDATSGAADANAVVIGQLRGQYEALGDQSLSLAPQLEMAALTLRSFGDADAATELAAVAAEMRELTGEMSDGTIEAEDFEGQLQALVDRADTAFTALDDIDRVQFSGVISGIGSIGTALTTAIGLARSLRASLPGAAPNGVAAPVTVAKDVGSFWDDPANMNLANPRTTPVLTSIPRPQAAPNDPDFGMPPLPKDTPKGGSKGGSSKAAGGKKDRDEFADTLKRLQEETAALEAEAASLLLVAASGEDYGDALEYARTRAELLTAAQEAGKAITPELMAQIEGLAQSYVTAGLEAEAAADKMQQIEEQTRRGEEALSGMFGSIVDGSMSAKDAVISLLAEIAKAQFIKGAMGMPGIGSASSFIGGLLSFDGGGSTRSGSRSGGLDGKGGFMAMLHPDETVIDHTKGQSALVPSIAAGSQQAQQASPQSMHITVGVSADNNGNLMPFVQSVASKVAGNATEAGLKQYHKMQIRQAKVSG